MKLAALLLILALQSSFGLMYNISNQTSLVSPNWRGGNNTTYFEWSEYDFYGFPVPPSSSRILNNPTPTLGQTSGVGFYQNDRFSSTPTIIGSASGNIYTGFGANGKQAFATLIVPTTPGVGLGNTTIFIQGRTVPEGGFAPAEQLILNYPRFTLNGIGAGFNIGINANREGQWYAQFDVASSNSTFNIDVVFPGGADTYPISIANLSVDTLWQPIPEPSTMALGILGLFFVIFKYIRSQVGLKTVSKTVA